MVCRTASWSHLARSNSAICSARWTFWRGSAAWCAPGCSASAWAQACAAGRGPGRAHRRGGRRWRFTQGVRLLTGWGAARAAAPGGQRAGLGADPRRIGPRPLPAGSRRPIRVAGQICAGVVHSRRRRPFVSPDRDRGAGRPVAGPAQVGACRARATARVRPPSDAYHARGGVVRAAPVNATNRDKPGLSVPIGPFSGRRYYSISWGSGSSARQQP